MRRSAPIIERALSDAFPSGGSFEADQREGLWLRCRLLFLAGLTVSLISGVVGLLVPSADPSPASPLSGVEPLFRGWLHAASFLAALGALHVLRGSRGALRAIAFGTIAFNILVLVFGVATYRPLTDSYFGLSLLLFLAAAFIPWRPPFQLALAALATFWFLILQALFHSLLPGYASFWAEFGGAAAWRNQTTWGALGIGILGFASVMVSRTLYGLRRTAHRAKRLGNYLVHEEIGQGGMGQVYYAQHSLMCRPTAVKLMRASNGDDPAALERFEREVKVSATLTHPNTITIYDVGHTSDRSLFYAMEYLEGLDLEKLVDRFGPVSPARLVYILRQVCGSLAEAHSRGIIHRDIKPSNIYLTRRGGLYDYVKVLDFGLAKEISAQAAGITKNGLLFGTPRYLAPETVYGNEVVDGRADLYSFGGVAYFMLTGRPPFTSESTVEVVVDHVKTTPPRPSDVTELSIPKELEDIVLKCLEKKPADRFQTACEVEEALRRVPLPEPWTRRKAEEWWELHGILGEHPHDHECFFDEESRDLPLTPAATRV